ncbi:GNAT family N-acetyltransferase [Haliea atlantica]|jgi:ElaA protein
MPTVPAAISTELAHYWHCKPFSALSAQELYRLLQLREAVFIIEQACIYPDLDGLDDCAWHLFCTDAEGRHLAGARCLPPDSAFAESSIGRVVTSPAIRGSGLGRELMQRALAFNRRQWPGQEILIGAQAHLEAFYASLGFVPEGAPYDEDGILHIHMRCAP